MDDETLKSFREGFYLILIASILDSDEFRMEEQSNGE